MDPIIETLLKQGGTAAILIAFIVWKGMQDEKRWDQREVNWRKDLQDERAFHHKNAEAERIAAQQSMSAVMGHCKEELTEIAGAMTNTMTSVGRELIAELKSR